jgi:septal ring factor EnvC (AmiA/AmiB activator)
MAAFRMMILLLATVQAMELRGSVQVIANPVRKVVTMLESMQKKVQAEGEKEEELYKKFSCYCTTGAAELTASISAANVKGPQLGADIKAAEEELVQVKQDLKGAQKDRADAKTATASATAIREKEAAAFAETKAELEGYISAISKAVAALEKGMAGFLQTSTAAVLRKIVANKGDSIPDDDREALLSFLSGKHSASYTPSSGEVTGMLKQMADSFSKSLSEATTTEEEAIKDYDALVAAKAKEIDALTASIEAKTTKVGELGMSIVQMKNDLGDSEEQLLDDKKLLAELEKGCSSKDKEYEARVNMRHQELLALAETIKILNDDDALELFKKTLPSPSLMQVKSTSTNTRAKAVNILEKGGSDHIRLGFIVMALKGQKVGFEKVIKLIDEMVVTLKKEGQDDLDKKEYCGKQMDSNEDKKKAIGRQISDLETTVNSAEEGISKVSEEISSTAAGIKALDKQVATATELRKEQHDDYKELMVQNGAAKQLLGFAKNRLNKFYNPKLYKPQAKEELSSQGAIERDMGAASLVQISEHENVRSSVEPPPATWDAYAKKSEENSGVISMIDLLIKDLEQEMTEAETEEKDAQSEYDETVADAKEKRRADSKSLTEKTATKADLVSDLQTAKDDAKAATKEMMAIDKLIMNLHGECDWLLQYFDARQEARSGEIDALQKAKGVLSGADFSL